LEVGGVVAGDRGRFELRRQMMRSVRNGKGFSLVLTDLKGLSPKEEQAALPTVGKALRHASYEGDFVAHLEGPVFAAVVVDDRDRTAADKADALIMADVVANAVLEIQAGAEPGTLASQLREGTQLRMVVHQASGMLSVQLDLPIRDALSRLRAYAYAESTPINDVARDVVERRLRMD